VEVALADRHHHGRSQYRNVHLRSSGRRTLTATPSGSSRLRMASLKRDFG